MKSCGFTLSGFAAASALIVAVLVAPWVCRAQDDPGADNPGSSAATDSPAEGSGSQLRETDIPAMPGVRIEAGRAASTRRAVAAASGGNAAPARNPNGGLSYVVRPGDALSSIAQLYGLDTAELARANRIGDDYELRSGQTLLIPNPFAAQARRLQATIDQLNGEAESARQKDRIDANKLQSSAEQVEQLRASNQELQRGVRVLPWWRGLALTAGAAALLMLGVTALTLLEWFVLRRRFRAMVEMNETIRRLDQRYKVALAKAELRLQQLYGRRRAVEEDSVKSPDEIEIERLNQQLKEVLEQQLQRLGVSTERAKGRGRLRELLSGVEESPVEARASRR